MIKILTHSSLNETEGDSVVEETLLDHFLKGESDKCDGEKFAEQVWARAMQSDNAHTDQQAVV